MFVCVFAKTFPALASQSCCEVSRPRAVGEYEYRLFELSGKRYWIAVGFSDDRLMVSYYVSRMHFYIFVILIFPCTSRDVTLGKFRHSYALNCTQNEIIQRAIDN